MPESTDSSIESINALEEEAHQLNRIFNDCGTLKKILISEWKGLIRAGLGEARKQGYDGVAIPENPSQDFDEPVLNLAEKAVPELHESYKKNIKSYYENVPALEKAGIFNFSEFT